MHGVLMQAYDVYAQTFNNVQSEEPPISGGIEKLIRWLTWGVQASGLSAMIYAGGKYGWEKMHGGAESPKMVATAAVGGLTASSAGTIMNSIVGT